MIVLDASAALELLRGSPVGAAVATHLRAGEGAHAPHLLDIEVTQGLHRLVASGVLPVARARQAVEDLVDLDLIRHEHELLLPRVWEMRENLTAYDGVYVALAEALDATLLTGDRRLADAPGHRARVALLA